MQVQGLSDVDQVVAVSESGSFYARHTDGTVSAWGRNTRGQLGDQTTTERPLPVKVLDLDGSPMRGVCSITAGPSAAMRAGRLMLELLAELVARNDSFAFETTLADRGYVRRIGHGTH